jgi:hypothetical protein
LEKKRMALPPDRKLPPGVVPPNENAGVHIPSTLDLREAARRVTERERLRCPMYWPDD